MKKVKPLALEKSRKISTRVLKRHTILNIINASGVLIVHAAIAFADAVTIKLSGWKCSGENHYEIISLLNDITQPNKNKSNAINYFRKIIDHKNLISYSGDEFHKKDIDKLWKHLERFIIWTNSILV